MNENDPESWRPCRAGEFAEVARNLVSIRRRRLAIQTVSSLCSVFLVIGIVIWLGPAQPIPIYATITCSECRNQMPAYHAHSLSAAEKQRMDVHFERCGGCREHYEALHDCNHKEDCEPENRDVSDNCKAVEKCKVSNCIQWNCQAQTCRSTHGKRTDDANPSECESKPL